MPNPKPIQVIHVYARNLFAEISRIRTQLPFFSFVSMDTEFPGVVYRPSAKTPIQSLPPFERYRFLKANVDAMKLIQVGLTLSDGNGNLPDFGTNNCFIWEFNFCDFDITKDLFAPDSIELLKNQGYDYKKNRDEGCQSAVFAQLLKESGLLRNNSLTWITFHSSYDFGYLIKILTGKVLPDQLDDFMRQVYNIFGIRVYDIKHIMKFCNTLSGGLERVAKTLEVNREVGKHHQAGSDSLLTLKVFLKIKEKFFGGHNIYERYNGVLFGLEVNY